MKIIEKITESVFFKNLINKINDLIDNSNELSGKVEFLDEIDTSKFEYLDKLQTLGVYCSEIGMSPTDENGDNHKLLLEAINKGYQIIVDGFYTISTFGASAVGNNIILKGLNRECGFNVTNGTDKTLFNISKDVQYIDLLDLKIINDSSNFQVFTNTSSGENDLNIKRFSVVGCTFERTSLIRLWGTRVYNESDALSVVSEFIFSNNTLKDIVNTFCSLSNVCFDSAKILNNNINNFYYILFDFGTENLPSNASEHYKNKYYELYKSKKEIIANGNTVICDDDWCLDENNGTYYCFLLSESESTTYTNNRVEGLKASKKIALYDAYLSSANVLVQNNIWKNNICFAEGKENNDLMKAKQGGGKKVYRYNTYTVTSEFIDMLVSKYGALTKNCWVNLVSIVDDSHWVIDNNLIDIKGILGFFSSNVPAKTFHFTNNNIFASDVKDSFLIVTHTEDSDTLFYNNKIVTDAINKYLKIIGNKFSNSGSCIIENNLFEALNSYFTMSVTDSVSASDIHKIKGNTFKCKIFNGIYAAYFVDNQICAQKVMNILPQTPFGKNFIANIDITGNESAEVIYHAISDTPKMIIAKITSISDSGTVSITNEMLQVTSVETTVETDEGTTVITTPHLKSTNLNTGEITYDGELNPANPTTSAISLGAITLRLSPTAGNTRLWTQISNKRKLYIDFKSVNIPT